MAHSSRLFGWLSKHLLPWPPAPAPAPGPERLVRVGCPAHNCGGRCLLVAHVRDGVITRLDADDAPDTLASPQLRACARGRAYLRRQYHPDRLLYPLRRVGPRGSGRFERISWDEALSTVAGELERVRATYGNGALFIPYGTGSYSQLNGSQTAHRLLNLYGGCLGYYNNYSWAATQAATPTVYGTQRTGNQRHDWLNARYILMWGWNPAEMRDETNSDYLLRLARERGARLVCIDPRLSPSAATLADEWVPIRPGTDAAMMSAMAYVMITEGLVDEGFIRTHCLGFDARQMPKGCEGAESYSDYILGRADGVTKTPAWAEAITAVPAATIARLAREYATIKPGVLYQGYGMQRRAYGEQVVRAGCALAAITGNVGIAGGWASGIAFQPDGGRQGDMFPVGENPVRARIPVFLWTEAVLRGRELGPEDGLVGAERLDSSIKLIYAVATNCLINQHANINRTAAILADERLVECIIVQDNFITPSARFADIVLPACTQFETWGLEDGWKYNQDVLLMPKLVEPPGEAKSDYAICAELAERLGLGEAYTQGRDERAWVAWMIEELRRERYPDIPTLDEFLAANIGAYRVPVEQPAVALADFRADPSAHPLDTESGKIELFSPHLYRLGRPHEVPAVPKYIQEWESPFGPEAQAYPLQAIGHHALPRAHSTHDNVDWLEEAFPQRVFINPIDAAARGIRDGDPVRVYNQRGAMVLPCRVSERIMPGVVDIPQGAWWTPDEDGVDRRGSINVLTSERPTPYAYGNTQQTIMVQVERARGSDSPQRRRGRGGTSGHLGASTANPNPSKTARPGQLAFYVDATACTGCKTCQMACKDRHGLGLGLLWRRVYEVVGGGWRRAGAAWAHDVYAYTLSLACNHCQAPICVEVCPTGAMAKRPDGIVTIDQAKCIGCRYCAWSCPYGAPQYDAASGRMSKCDFCLDDIVAGRPPACVAACPMRALDWGERAELEARYPGATGKATHPLPGEGLTRPALLIRAHPAAGREGRIANREEV
jgi:anaerobic dimethyl sulfoxide reductase subunit A